MERGSKTHRFQQKIRERLDNCADKWDNLGEMNKVLENYTNLTQEKREILNSPIPVKEENTKHHSFRNLHKLLQKRKEEGTFASSLEVQHHCNTVA